MISGRMVGVHISNWVKCYDFWISIVSTFVVVVALNSCRCTVDVTHLALLLSGVVYEGDAMLIASRQLHYFYYNCSFIYNVYHHNKTELASWPIYNCVFILLIKIKLTFFSFLKRLKMIKSKNRITKHYRTIEEEL